MSDKHKLDLDTQVKQSRHVKGLTAENSRLRAEVESLRARLSAAEGERDKARQDEESAMLVCQSWMHMAKAALARAATLEAALREIINSEGRAGAKGAVFSSSAMEIARAALGEGK